MRSHLFRLLVTTGLAGVTLVSTVASAEPDVRDHRDGRGPHYDADGGPRVAPPPPRAERQGARRGFVWVGGTWEWNRGRWDWTAGHWERERAGRTWRDHRWEKRGDVFVRIDGDWVELDTRPSQAPPSLRDERPTNRPGFVWVRGHWDWNNGRWDWNPGHHERTRAGKRWRDVRWELNNGVWVRVDGDWDDEVAAGPTKPPPPPPPNAIGRVNPGEQWIPGFYEWRNFQYVWKPGTVAAFRPGYRFEPGQWTLRGHHYEWTDGKWVNDYPNAAPPTPREERIAARQGFTYLPGRWDWRNGQWQWMDGRWERERQGERFTTGRWEQQNGRWVWIEGKWGAYSEFPTAAPPPLRQEARPPQPAPDAFWNNGHWEWTSDHYSWVGGQWLRPQPGYTWITPKWGERDGHWFWKPGGFRANFPFDPPPADLAEQPQARRGYEWVPGHMEWDERREKYKWRAGQLERSRPGERFVPGRWSRQRDPISSKDWYVWTAGAWQRDASPPSYPPSAGGPTSAPPPPRDERYDPKSGFVWARGHYEWRNNNYEWVGGHWERERAYKKWVDARWELRGNLWVFIPAAWQ